MNLVLPILVGWLSSNAALVAGFVAYGAKQARQEELLTELRRGSPDSRLALRSAASAGGG